MTDYLGNRHNEKFVYRRVSWPGMVEGEEYRQFTGGSVEKSAFSDLKESGSVNYQGDTPPDDHDLLRIYYEFDDDDGNHAEHAIATMRMYVSEPTYQGDIIKGTVELYSLLQVLSDKVYGSPFTIAKGTKAVTFAKQLAEGLNLKVNSASSSYTIATDHTFDNDASYLTIINWLLTVANFQSVFRDEYGVLQMQPYIEPTEREVSFTFVDDEQSIMYPEVKQSYDWGSTPNVVRMIYETDEETLIAAAYNIDPASRASIVNRGAEKTLIESINELQGTTQAARITELKSKSLAKLIENSSDIEYVTLKHAWIPILVNNAIGVTYREAGLDWKGAITNLKVDLKPSVPCELKARRYVRSSLVTRTEGSAL